MNELDQYQRLFRGEHTIKADDRARSEAIAAAMKQYERISLQTQETGRATRLRDRIANFWNRSPHMPALTLNQGLMAGASVAALMTLIVSGPALHSLITEVSVQPVHETASEDSAPDVTKQVVAGREAAPAEQAAKDQSRVDASPAEYETVLSSPEVALQEAAPSAERQVLLVPPPEVSAEIPFHLMQRDVSTEIAIPEQGTGYQTSSHDRFSGFDQNPVKRSVEEPLSTFAIDTDTTSYSFIRRSLMENQLPPKDAVRVEEMINYFPYDYEGPADRSQPFKANVTLMQTPWNPDTRLMHIGIKGFSLDGAERPRANLVFLIDTSGSMDEPGKLQLLINSFRMLLDTLSPDDSVAIVAYAGNAGTVLAPTRVSDRARILAALDALSAGGSTAGAEGIEQAYALAEQNFDAKGVNRIILATDGDFNVGISSPRELESFVERKRENGIYLSVLGFGRGNYNDALMQALAQSGNGNAAYIDTLNEARKVLVEEATSTLFPIANDVKIQIEFNPAAVSEYRLIGYETRLLNREDFNNDRVDAGDIGAGHTVTAIYEVTPKGSRAQLVDPLRYGAQDTSPQPSGEYAFVKIRYKLPGDTESRLITEPVTAANAEDSTEAKFAAAVAAFGQILRGGQYTKSFSYDDVIALASANRGPDEFGYRAEFLNLVRLARSARGLP